MERLGEDVLEAVAALWDPEGYCVHADTSRDWIDDEWLLLFEGLERLDGFA
jgi:hypothetical protein